MQRLELEYPQNREEDIGDWQMVNWFGMGLVMVMETEAHRSDK